MDTYASALHSFIDFCTSMHVRPPSVRGHATRQAWCDPDPAGTALHSLHSHAIQSEHCQGHYSRLAQVQGAPTATVEQSHPAIKSLMRTVAIHQGPGGLPVGKQGLSKPVLRLLLHHLSQRLKQEMMLF